MAAEAAGPCREDAHQGACAVAPSKAEGPDGIGRDHIICWSLAERAPCRDGVAAANAAYTAVQVQIVVAMYLKK